jgi:hypothetical protein
MERRRQQRGVARQGSAAGEELLHAVQGRKLAPRGKLRPALQGPAERFDRHHAVQQIPLQHAVDDLLERLVDDAKSHQRRHRTPADLLLRIVVVLALEGVIRGERHVEHQRQRPGVVRRGGAAGLEALRRGILGAHLGAA